MYKELIALKDELTEDKFTSDSTSLFEGAGLVISDDDGLRVTGNYILVTTQYAQELSALIFSLKEIFKERLNFINKYAFFGNLGEAANTSIKNNATKKTILLNVVDEAIRFGEGAETLRYFAYGSNMDEAQMANRCPTAKTVGVGKLQGFAFALDSEGVATVIEAKDSYVWGVAWEIGGKDIVTLDKHEGIHTLCYRHSFISVEYEGQEHEALMYISNRDENDGNRRNGYFEKIIRAARRWQFPEEYIQALSCS